MEKVLNEFVKWFNERNSYPIYPCEKDVKMFLSFKTNEPCERKADSNNEGKKRICPYCGSDDIYKSLKYKGYYHCAKCRNEGQI